MLVLWYKVEQKAFCRSGQKANPEEASAATGVREGLQLTLVWLQRQLAAVDQARSGRWAVILWPDVLQG